MKRSIAGLAIATALLVSGCSLLGGDTQPSDDPASQPPPATSAPSGSTVPSATTTSSTGPSTAPTTGATPPDGADQLGTPVATRKSSQDGQEVVLTLYPVVRDGATSHLNFTLSSKASEQNKVQIADMLTDNDNKTGEDSSWAADGLQLIDGKNSKVYLVASDGNGRCLCSAQLLGKYLYDNQPKVLSSTFAAPPADVTSVDVRVPNFGTVVRVPVS